MTRRTTPQMDGMTAKMDADGFVAADVPAAVADVAAARARTTVR